MAKRAHEPTEDTRRQVETMVGFGMPLDTISKLLKLPKVTIVTHYREEIDTGMAKANAQVSGFLFKQAQAGNVPAIIHWLKSRAAYPATDTPEPTPEDDPSAGLNARQKIFAEEIAKGSTQREAFARAGYKIVANAATDANASRLISNDRVVKYIRRLQDRAAFAPRKPSSALRLICARSRLRAQT